MSIERGDYSIEYEITGIDPAQTAFAFEFPIKEASQILCFDITPEGNEDKTDIVTPIAAGYFHVSAAPGGHSEGGSVALSVPLAAGHILRITRKTPATQKKRFSNQDRIRPEEIEDGLDRAVMWMQENDPSKIIADRIAAEAAIKQAIQDEATARKEEDAALQKQIDELQKRVNALADADAEKMPVAPDDGRHYVGSGDTWIPAELASPTDPEPPPSDELGGPFDFDADGDAVIVERTTYDANDIWGIAPNELVLLETSQPGDTDGVFIIDGDGDAVLTE